MSLNRVNLNDFINLVDINECNEGNYLINLDNTVNTDSLVIISDPDDLILVTASVNDDQVSLTYEDVESCRSFEVNRKLLMRLLKR